MVHKKDFGVKGADGKRFVGYISCSVEMEHFKLYSIWNPEFNLGHTEEFIYMNNRKLHEILIKSINKNLVQSSSDLNKDFTFTHNVTLNCCLMCLDIFLGFHNITIILRINSFHLRIKSISELK